jgi:adenine-specific DNA-methyltransferase
MANGNRFGPENPHPLSTLKTELVWEGKYDEYGNRREVDVAGCAMPLQKIETIDEPRSRAEAQGKLFDPKKSHPDDFRNMLIWGDNELVMASLLKDFKGKIDLIYIDPPFDVGADFTMDVPIGDERETIGKDQSTLEMIAYRDMWGKGTDSYLYMMYERLTLMRELLSEKGSIFVHLAPTVSHYFRSVMDEVFAAVNFRNEIIVNRPISKNLQRQFETIVALPQGHDVIIWYSASPTTRYRNLLVPYEGGNPEGYWHRFWSGADRPTMRYELLGETLTHGQWKWKEERAKQAVENYQKYLTEGAGRTLSQYWHDTGRKLEFIRNSNTGTVENWFSPSDDKIGDTVWEDINAYENEKDFPTQKHRELLSRIIEFATTENDLVADFFCGSGTTGVVAEHFGRRWIMADLGRFAVHTSRKRLIDVQRKHHEEAKPYRPFDVYNLGRYERQWWQRERLKGADDEHRKVVLSFYRAEALNASSSPLLHGRKGPALVHVDSIDSVFSRVELRDVATAAKQAGAKQINCLAWEFEMDLRLEAHRLQAELGIEIHLLRIPREIMEKNRKEVTFFEVATLEAEPIYKKNGKARIIDIKLKKYLPSLAEVPEKELEALEERAIKHGFDFIDFWAVDFDYMDGQPFKHHWQAYRTRKDRSLPTVSDQEFNYEKPGRYLACVKVVDTFGCDTSITVPIEI